MAMVPCGAWYPDRPVFQNPGALEALNVVPTHGASEGQIAYRPMKSLTAYSDALSARCMGGVGIVEPDGATYVFAGTQTTLQQLAAGSTAWTSLGSSYDAGAEGRWSFTKFGEVVIATNGADPIQAFTLGSSSDFVTLSSAAPAARYVATVPPGFVMVAYTSDNDFGTQPQGVWWSAINDPGTWPTIGSDTAVQLQSDRQTLYGDGGRIMGIVGGLLGCDVLVFVERQIWRGAYAGGRVVFSFDLMEGVRGTPAQGSIAPWGGRCYYVGEDGFYVTDGSSSQPVGNGQVDREFFRLLDASNIERITSVIDPVQRLWFIAFPGPGNLAGTPNHMFIYSIDLGCWSHSDGYEVELLCNTASFGVTVDTFDSIFPGGVDAQTMPVDSRIFAGGRPILSAFSDDHELSYFSGANLAATVDTSEANIADNQRGSLVNGVWPLADGSTTSVDVAVRDRMQDAVTWGSPNAVNDMGFAPARARGRYHRARITKPAGDDWTYIQGVEPETVATGRRA
jgi:hypothetical protein